VVGAVLLADSEAVACGSCVVLVLGTFRWSRMPLLVLDTGTERAPSHSLRVLGVFMLVGYGWFFTAFVLRLKRGTWSRHCDSRISFLEALMILWFSFTFEV